MRLNRGLGKRTDATPTILLIYVLVLEGRKRLQATVPLVERMLRLTRQRVKGKERMADIQKYD